MSRFDLLQGEGVIGALVPIALALDGVEAEAVLVGPLAPVRPLVAGDALHDLSAGGWPERGALRGARRIRRGVVPDGVAEGVEARGLLVNAADCGRFGSAVLVNAADCGRFGSALLAAAPYMKDGSR